MTYSEDIKVTLPVKLQRLRKSKSMRQSDVANQLMTSVATVSHYENGVHMPDIETLIRLAQLYDVSLDELCASSLG